jgi:hypothetical protein
MTEENFYQLVARLSSTATHMIPNLPLVVIAVAPAGVGGLVSG